VTELPILRRKKYQAQHRFNLGNMATHLSRKIKVDRQVSRTVREKVVVEGKRHETVRPDR
jgi:hypothetical protein